MRAKLCLFDPLNEGKYSSERRKAYEREGIQGIQADHEDRQEEVQGSLPAQDSQGRILSEVLAKGRRQVISRKERI